MEKYNGGKAYTFKVNLINCSLYNQVLIKEFQVNFLKYFKQMVKKISHNNKNTGVIRRNNKEIIKLNLKIK